MTDSTGHMDWPGAGPLSVQVPDEQGIPTPYYTHPNQEKHCIELIKINHGKRDTWVGDFPSIVSARRWLLNEIRCGRLS
jgi:hypothetical protein